MTDAELDLSVGLLTLLFTVLVFFAAPHTTPTSNPFPRPRQPPPTRGPMAIPSFTPTPSLNAGGNGSLPPELKGGLSPRARYLLMALLTLGAGYFGVEISPVVKEPECVCPPPAPPAPVAPVAPPAPDYVIVDPNR